MRTEKTEKIQNDKCFACRFCLWYDNLQEYRCSIKGCIENSSFVRYQGKYINGQWK